MTKKNKSRKHSRPSEPRQPKAEDTETGTERPTDHNVSITKSVKTYKKAKNRKKEQTKGNTMSNNKIIAWGTIALVILGIFTLILTRKSTSAEQRARLAPVSAVLDGPLEIGKEIKVNVFVENYGKQPALNVHHVSSSGITMPFSKEEAIQQATGGPAEPVVNVCDGLLPQKGYPTIYPSNVQHGRFNVQKTMIADDVLLSGNRIFFVHGCVAYETLDEIHHSEYCFFLSPPHANNGVWTFRSCRGGHRAD